MPATRPARLRINGRFVTQDQYNAHEDILESERIMEERARAFIHEASNAVRGNIPAGVTQLDPIGVPSNATRSSWQNPGAEIHSYEYYDLMGRTIPYSEEESFRRRIIAQQNPHTYQTINEPPMWQCRRCEARLQMNIQRVRIPGGNDICQSCYDDHYTRCHQCEQIFPENEAVRTRDGNLFCERCGEDHTFSCDACNENIEGDSSCAVGNDTLCEDCFSEHAFFCEECEENERTANATYCNNCERDICQDCWTEHVENNENHLSPEQLAERERTRAANRDRTIRDAEMRNPYRNVSGKKYKGDPKKARQLKITRLVGVEIEGEEGDVFGLGLEMPREIGISRDGSLHNRGIEVQTPPASCELAEEFINKACEGLQKKGFRGTKSCGLHVHIDARDFRSNHKKIIQVIKTFYSVEDILFSMLPPSRWQSTFCRRLSERYLYDSFRKPLSKRDVEKAWYKEEGVGRISARKQHKYDDSRYFGLNVHSLFFRGTIELRYHSGTVSPKKIIPWVNLLLHLVEYATNNYDEKIVEDLFAEPTSERKFYMICDLFNLSSDLREYMWGRISKFNPGFSVQFNKGKRVRMLERRINSRKRTKLNKLIEKFTKELEPMVRANYEQMGGRNGYSKRKIENIIKQELKREARDKALSEMPYDMQADLRDPQEEGFVTNTEMTNILSYITLGRNVEQGRHEGGVDTEE